ncbi:MAG: hypothetical protein IPK52_27150 [Chloroflexi bacterium]|nr:hypothetical protein [Chloroflexota bacterium]
MPKLGRLTRLVTPVSLVGDTLTVCVSDDHTYLIVTYTQHHFVEYVTQVFWLVRRKSKLRWSIKWPAWRELAAPESQKTFAN